ncbi:MAG: hypothetical protein ACI814_003379, partial [Mariniblastus sp.]
VHHQAPEARPLTRHGSRKLGKWPKHGSPIVMWFAGVD